MKKFILLLALALCAMMLFTGCANFNQAVEQMVNDMEQQEAEDEPKPTLEPLTVPMYTDRAALYQYYNQVAVDDTLESLTGRYGEPTPEVTENGTNYTWIMEDGYGFCCTFYESGALRAKILYYEDLRQLAELSNANGIGNVTMLSSSYTLDMAKSLMGGRGMQVMASVVTPGSAPEIEYLYCWMTADGEDVVQILFDKDGKVKQVVYNLREEQ